MFALIVSAARLLAHPHPESRPPEPTIKNPPQRVFAITDTSETQVIFQKASDSPLSDAVTKLGRQLVDDFAQ